MNLTYLEVNRLPGIDEPLHLSTLVPGVNVVVGPNASGKSSFVRALLAVLYPREHDGVIGVEAHFNTPDGSSLVARRLGQDVGWERDGRPTTAPDLPAFHLAGTYTIRLEDLMVDDRSASSTSRGSKRSSQAPGSGNGFAANELDKHIADSIAKQLTGGIDLEAVRRSIGKRSEAGKKLSIAVSEARKERQELERRREALSQREAALPTQYQELETARRAAGRRHLVTDAEQLLAARSEAARLEVELRSFPPDLDKLRGDEDESLAKLEAAVRTETDNAAALEQELDAVRRALAAAPLAADLNSSDVVTQLERADQLVEDADRLEHKATERRSLQAQVREAARRAGAGAGTAAGSAAGTAAISAAGTAAGATPGAVPEVTDETIERVEQLLQRRQAAGAEAEALTRQRNQLPPPEPQAEGASHDHLVRLRANLLRWLAAPTVEPRRPAWTWGVALALGLALVAAGSLGAPQTVLLSVAGATFLWLLIVCFLFPPLASAVRRQVEAETSRAQTEHGVTGPLRWEHAEVSDRVVAIDEVLAARQRHAEDEKQRADVARALDADLAAARSRQEEAQADLDELRATTGFAAGPDVLLAPWLHAVRDLDRLRTASAGVEVEGARLAERVKRARTALYEFLDAARPVGVGAPPRADLPAEELRAAVRGLARAAEQRDADRRRLASLTSDRDRCTAELARLRDERERLLLAAGLEDRPSVADELRLRLAALPGWREANQRHRAGRARSEALQQRLAGDHELLALVEAGDRGAIEEVAAQCSAAQVRAEELSRLISQTEREIELAASDRSIAQAGARLEEATEVLTAHRDEALRLAAAHFVVNRVDTEHRPEDRPPALARAAALFERFTRGEFVLRFEGAGVTKRRLAAADRSGRPVELNELSTGTRAQLLIASRLAFALEAEGAGGAELAPALPFFLDEALTTSDPERFAAVASAILDVATLEGRQFIYLSARSDDAELWRKAAAAHGTEVSLVQLGSQGTGSAATPAAN